MTTGSTLQVVRATLGFAWRSFLAETPLRVVFALILTRQVLQTLFFVLVASGRQREFAFVGAVFAAQTVAAIYVADIVLRDKTSQTSSRFRTSPASATILLLVRAWPYALLGWFGALASAVVVAPLVGMSSELPGLARVAPLAALASIGLTFAGVAIAVPTSFRNAEALGGNLLSYLVITAGGVFVARSALPVLGGLGAILPTTNALAAAREALAGKPFASHLAMELLVLIGWFAVAGLMVMEAERRAYRNGLEPR